MMTRKTPISKDIKEKSRVTKEEWREYTKSVWSIPNVSHKTHPAMFPTEIPHRLTKLFSFWGETILDPFCGIGTTGEACLQIGRKFIGVDTNKDFIDISSKSFKEKNYTDFKLICENSNNLQFIEDSSINLIICSPPYWNKADYGEVNGNIGSINSYKEFLEAIKPIFNECYRILEPERKFCVVIAHVNQNTTDGLLTFPIEADFQYICRDIGFLVENTVIWSKDGTGGKWGSSNKQRPIFGSYPYPHNFKFKNVHEYILIFKKPGKKNMKSTEKRPHYSDLMV